MIKKSEVGRGEEVEGRGEEVEGRGEELEGMHSPREYIKQNEVQEC